MAYKIDPTIDGIKYKISISDTAALAFVRRIYGADFGELSENELIEKITSLDDDYNLLDGLDRIVQKYFDICDVDGNPVKTFPILGKLDLATGIIPLIQAVTSAFPDSNDESEETENDDE